MKKISIANIRVNGGTQSRAGINRDVVSDYAEAMQDGAEFPPLVVFFDGSTYWLADGFHRYEAASQAQQWEVMADIRQGTQRDAILHSVGANASHGLRRTNDDKRRAVMTLLNDETWATWTDREIARQCGVSAPLVASVRKNFTVNSYSEKPRTYTTRHGTEAQMDTSNIGKAKPVEQPEAEEQGQPAAASGEEPEERPERADAQPNAEPERAEPQPEPDPYGYAKLSEDALIDTANGLRADLDEAKAEVTSLKTERDRLKSENEEIANATDLGPTVSKLTKQIATIKGSRDDALAEKARLQRQVNAQKAEIEKLKKSLERQEIAL